VAFSRAYTAAADGWLAGLFARATAGSGPDGLALVAVGGYGRAELCPASDLDLVLVHTGKRDRGQLKAVAERLWYPVWDSGRKLGHATRTVKEALALAGSDLNTATALLDTRLLSGDPALAAELARKALAQWQAGSSRRLGELANSVAERHDRAGEVAFLLEPDLKEGRGGLRDIHALGWAEAARRILLEGDDEALDRAHRTLLEVRVELQRRTGKATDRLVLQEQDGVASALGDADADALMARVAGAARTVAWTSDEAWDRILSSLKGPRGRVASVDRPAGPGLVLREGLVELAPGVDPSSDSCLVLRAAAAAAQAGTRLGRHTLDRLATGAPPAPPEPWPDEARSELVRLLGAGRAAIPVLEALDQRGLLVGLLPEWAAVRCRPQRNAYHRFTVDRHLCEAAAEAASLVDRVGRPDLLLVGAWLHDIGKGFVGERGDDHTVAGEAVVEEVAARMGFAPADVATLVALVRHHLLLPEVATRRDLDDVATIDAVAKAVGDPETLVLLQALTEADSVATGSAAWSPWKAGLVGELVARVDDVLRGQAPDTRADFPTEGQRALVERARADGGVVVEGDGHQATVVAADRPGMFCRVAGALALSGLDVLAAKAWSSDDGMAVEHFQVEPAFGRPPDWSRVAADIRAALDGTLPLEDRLAERSRRYAGRSPATAAEPPRTSVIVDAAASATATVVDVRAPDRIGTLYRITRALAELELDIRSAKVATVGHEVVDAFYIVDAEGAKVTGPERAAEIERAVLEQLALV
jgi:[protein-PII] uridylyltransferase